MSDIARDPYLDLPLDGVQLIEASAGTGKTFTLATLYARLVIELKLPVDQILAVTFTEAALGAARRGEAPSPDRWTALDDGQPLGPRSPARPCPSKRPSRRMA